MDSEENKINAYLDTVNLNKKLSTMPGLEDCGFIVLGCALINGQYKGTAVIKGNDERIMDLLVNLFVDKKELILDVEYAIKIAKHEIKKQRKK